VNLIDTGAPQKVAITAAEFRAKYNSKKECFNFLSVDCKAYLSSYETVTIYFLKDLVSGKKKCRYYFIIVDCVQLSSVTEYAICSAHSTKASL